MAHLHGIHMQHATALHDQHGKMLRQQQDQDGRLTEGAVGGCISHVRVALILHSLDRVDDGCEPVLQQAPAVVGWPTALWVGDAVVGGAILGDCRPAPKAVTA